MGLPSHIDQGVVFGTWGLWQVSNVLLSFVQKPKEFRFKTWFPVHFLPSTLKFLELWILLVVISLFLFRQISHILPDFSKGYIQADHLQRYQHVTFGVFFLLYLIVALVSENCGRLPLPAGALHAILALGFCMELLVFHFGHHTGDTLESFVHMLMQLVLVGLIVGMLLEIAYPRSFLISLGRSMLLLLKGTWFFHIGVLINFPAFAPRDCDFVGHFPVCPSGHPLMRAKSLQILVFGWQVLGILVCTLAAYAVLVRSQVGLVSKDHYRYLSVDDQEEDIGSITLGTIKESTESELLIVPQRTLSKRRSYKALGHTTP